MTLRKIKGVYHATFRTVDGKTKTISTKCKSESEARKVAKMADIAEMELAARAGRLSNEVLGHITTGRKLTVEKALAPFQQWMLAVSKAPKTIHNTLTIVRAWMNHSKVGHLPPAAVTEEHISKYINDPESASKAHTREVALASIRSFFHFLCAKGWAVANPSQLIHVDRNHLTHAQQEAKTREPFTGPEIKAIIKECTARKEATGDAFWLFAVLVAKETGLRLGDIVSLEWASFTKAGKIIVHTKKTKARVEIPITTELEDLIASEIPVSDPRYMFPDQMATLKDPSKRAWLSVQFARILKKAGIHGKSFHCFRHTVASGKFAEMDKDALAQKLAECLTVDQIKALLGHTNAKTTKRYIHK